jgi:hypothetical protein
MKMHLLVLGVYGLVYPWSAAYEPYCPQYRFTKSVLCEQSCSVKARDDMEIDNDPVEIDKDL